jgi:hypothetical protein
MSLYVALNIDLHYDKVHNTTTSIYHNIYDYHGDITDAKCCNTAM